MKFGEQEQMRPLLFETNETLDIGGSPLPQGKYTLWTVPKDTIWTVIFNTKQYDWGVDDEMKPMWDPNYDALKIDVPVQKLKLLC